MIGIIGASGYIGWELYNFLKDRGEKVIGTYFNHKKPGLVKYELGEYFDFSKCSYVVIAAACTKIRFCEDNPIIAYYTNVFATRYILLDLNKQGIPCYFISSDIAENPTINYGRYKLMVENFIKEWKLNCHYSRPGKINKDNIKQLCEVIYDDYKSRMRKKDN